MEKEIEGKRIALQKIPDSDVAGDDDEDDEDDDEHVYPSRASSRK